MNYIRMSLGGVIVIVVLVLFIMYIFHWIRKIKRNRNYEKAYAHLVEWIMKLFKNYQFVNWYPEWHGFHFIKSNPLKKPEAFHLIYKWSLWLGWWEIRKFMTDKEMEKALEIYKKNGL